MMKKRKNMQFFAAAALTATLITGQFTYVPVMAGSTTEVEVSSLIPDNVTVEQPVPLSEISLPKSDYGTLSWVDSSSVPSKRVQSYDVVFHPYNTADLAKFSGWDGQSDAIYSSVTVVVSSFSKDTDYTDNAYENQDSQETQENGNTGENGEDTTTETPGSTEISDNGEVKDESEAKDQDTPDTDDTADKVQDTAETPDNKDVSTDTEKKDSADATETPEVTAAPDDAENPEVTGAPETTETPDVTATPDVTDTPDTTETPEITEAPESDKDNIFDGTEKKITPDERAQTVTDEEPSDEEKIELAATNHTCNGISVMKNIVLSAFLSGGLSAVAGGIEVLAIQKKLLEGISSNCGYTAVLIALVAFNNPIGVFFVAVLYAAMQVGASSMQRQLGVPSAIVNILIGLVVVLILGRELFHFKKKQAKVGKGGNA